MLDRSLTDQKILRNFEVKKCKSGMILRRRTKLIFYKDKMIVKSYDIVIIGAGMGGSLTAALLARQGLRVAIVDRYRNFPNDFRVEQLVGDQISTLRNMGMLEKLVEGVQLVDCAHSFCKNRSKGIDTTPHYGLSYQTMVARTRCMIPPTVDCFYGARVISVEDDVQGSSRKTVHVAELGELTAGLVVAATGLNPQITEKFGCRLKMRREYSTAIGFDVVKKNGPSDKITLFYRETMASKLDYLTIFPFENGRIRGNLFSFHNSTDAWVRSFRTHPEQSLRAVLNLDRLGPDFRVTDVKIRFNDVMRWDGHSLNGLLMVGDAFATACPSTGMGLTKLLNDVRLLCEKHIPRWVAAGGAYDCAKQYYDDPAKTSLDAAATRDSRYRKLIITRARVAGHLERAKTAATRAVSRNFASNPGARGGDTGAQSQQSTCSGN
jgi:2-polyprenyl-6-methoxyphenol hydroxylase-like FAD-dependent oxidoreductase